MEAKLSLIDAHSHLDELSDLSESLHEARAAGIKGIIAVGIHLDSNKRTLKIAEENRGYVHPALGYHPWEIRGEDIERCLSFVRDHIHECVALGEIGLDYKTKVKKELQRLVFGDLLDIAREHSKPIIVHCRYSHHRALKMVRERGVKRAIFHWYTGPLGLLEEILAMGYFISATPALSYSPPHQEAIKCAPLERIVLETDTPVKYGGKEARPKDVHTTMIEVTRLKGLDPFTVAEQTTANASWFFRIPFDSGGMQG
ncbi:MAG: TatD family hydrolase [Deltaproteobacteria bacterium]|nr:MAG: TatD family hydrolase [Deltaproteobacteria bacterium]